MSDVSLDLNALRRKLQMLRETIAGLQAEGEAEEVLEPLRRRQAQIELQLETAGGAVVAGDVSTRDLSMTTQSRLWYDKNLH